jgi:hypothetical protein
MKKLSVLGRIGSMNNLFEVKTRRHPQEHMSF